jgi:ATP-dependent Lon protease
MSVNDIPETLNRKVSEVFGRLAIDKRRLPSSQLGRRSVPAYVAEWLLDSLVPGEGPVTPEELRKVQEWADRFLPLPDESKVIKNRLLNGEVVKLLTPVEVEIVLNRKISERVACLKLLGLRDVHISDRIVNDYPDLLRQGMWGVAELMDTQDGVALISFKPMQATVNLELFKDKSAAFSLVEWRALLLTSMGYNPWVFEEQETTYLLCRLLPLVEKNLHVLELAPKGTGKSYLYENISPRVRLVSGGNVSPAVLFVNNASGQWGLLARFAVVVLDEVQTMKFERPQEIVGGLKGFLANGRLTRGGLHETASPCSLVMLANIALDSEQRPLHDPLLMKDLPDFLQETAFIDRLRGIVPGWKVRAFAKERPWASDCTLDDFLLIHRYVLNEVLPRMIEQPDAELLGDERMTKAFKTLIAVLADELKVEITDRKLIKLYKLIVTQAFLFNGGRVTREELKILRYCGNNFADVQKIKAFIEERLDSME